MSFYGVYRLKPGYTDPATSWHEEHAVPWVLMLILFAALVYAAILKAKHFGFDAVAQWQCAESGRYSEPKVRFLPASISHCPLPAREEGSLSAQAQERDKSLLGTEASR